MDENENMPITLEKGSPTPLKMFPWGSPSIGQIAGALAKAQGAMKNPAKTKRVNQRRWSKAMNGYVDASYGYAPLSELQDVSREALAANGIAVFQDVHGGIERIEVTTALLHSSGEWLATDIIVFSPRGTDEKPPSIQDMGSIISYLKRYSLGAALNLSAAEDDTDGDAERQDEPTEQPANRGRNAQPPKQDDKGKQGAEKVPEKSAAGDTTPEGEVKKARADFSAALMSKEWKDAGMSLKELGPIADRLFKAGTLSAEKSDNYNADDYYIVMAHADLEIAKKAWKAAGIMPATWEETAASLAEAQEIKTADFDKMDDADVCKFMEAVDDLAGAKK